MFAKGYKYYIKRRIEPTSLIEGEGIVFIVVDLMNINDWLENYPLHDNT